MRGQLSCAISTISPPPQSALQKTNDCNSCNLLKYSNLPRLFRKKGQSGWSVAQYKHLTSENEQKLLMKNETAQLNVLTITEGFHFYLLSTSGIVLRFPNEIFVIAPSSTFVLETDEHVIVIPRNSRQLHGGPGGLYFHCIFILKLWYETFFASLKLLFKKKTFFVYLNLLLE